MKKIYKFNLEIKDSQTLTVREGFKILSCGEQDGVLVIWILVDLSKPKEYIIINLLGTGQDISTPDELFNEWDYISTVQMKNRLVWHVFGIY